SSPNPTPQSPISTLDGLARLVDHSLVRQELGPGGEPRFSMLEVIREYALARLVEHGEDAILRRSHAHLFLALAEEGAAGLHGPDQPRWLARLDAEVDNLRAALTWSLSVGGVELGLRIAASLWWFWWVSGRTAEGRRWLAALLPSISECTPVRALALMGAGSLAFFAGDFAAAASPLEETMACARRLDLPVVLAYAQVNVASIRVLEGEPGGQALLDESAGLLRTTGEKGRWYLATTLVVQLIVALQSGDTAAALRYGQEGLALFQALGQPYGIASVLNYLGDVARARGDWTAAAASYEASLPLMRRSGVRSDLPALLHNLGYAALATGNAARSAALFAESLALHRIMGNRAGIVESLYGFAAVAASQGSPVQAARLFGAARVLETTAGMPPWAVERAERARHVEATRAQLPKAAFATALAAGSTLTLEQAIAEALALVEMTP
ncbi:MAG TPA: hypothetical protein VER55_07180, partial [Ardenticatenaceae bacterium]|nr:hypothetical protein [Ardenticatenaceae bacterium]